MIFGGHSQVVSLSEALSCIGLCVGIKADDPAPGRAGGGDMKKRKSAVCKCGHSPVSHVWDGSAFPCEKCPAVACSSFEPKP